MIEKKHMMKTTVKKPAKWRALWKALFDFGDDERLRDERRSYSLPPSIAQKFNVDHYDHDSGAFVFNDGKTVAAVYELTPIPTEGQSPAYLEEIRQGFGSLFQHVFDAYDNKESPWIVQLYVGDDYSLEHYYETFIDYIKESAKETPFSKLYARFFKAHLSFISKKGGLFIDPLSNNQFQGRIRRVRLVMYRYMSQGAKLVRGATPESDLCAMCTALEHALQEANLFFKRYDETDFYHWLKPWLSPQPSGFGSTQALLKSVPFPKNQHETPPSFDVIQTLFDSAPRSDEHEQVWYFDGLPHKFIPILGLTRLPQAGHLTAERKMTHSQDPAAIKYYAPFDRFPEGAIFTMTVVIQHPDYRMKQLERIEKKAKRSLEISAQLAQEEAEVAKVMVTQGNYLYPTAMGVFIKGHDLEDLYHREEGVMALLKSQGFHPIRPEKDLVKLDSYIRFLPMNYHYGYDKKYLVRARLLSIKQIASIFPCYGRSRGTGHPCFSGFNRLTEPLDVDPFADYQNNAHGLIFGTTGSGKSCQSGAFLMQTMAVYSPRMVIIDAGGSFRYLINLWERLGIKVNKIEIKMEQPDYTLNPFAQTKAMLAQVEKIERIEKNLTDYEAGLTKRFEEHVCLSEENRDYLMEFVTAAILMVTGAEKKEMDQLGRQDRFLILEGIKRAGRVALTQGFNEMIPGDLAKMLEEMALELSKSGLEVERAKATRLINMADGLRAFIQLPLNALYFNRRGKALPEADVTWFEMGLFKDDRLENEAPRALSFITMMNNTMTLAEKYRTSGRFTLFFGDEIHIVTNNPITAASYVQCSKMSRKVGLWLWGATQNISDFPEHAKKALSMMEYMIFLWCDKAERKQIAKLIELTDEQSALIHSLRKEKGKYIEGVLMSKSASYLYRNVPPREVLALMMTDPDENSERERLERHFKCDGVEASLLMAQKLKGQDYDLTAVRRLFHADS